MVTSNKQRRLQNAKRAAKLARKRARKQRPQPKPPVVEEPVVEELVPVQPVVEEPTNKLLPPGAKPDDGILLDELDLPTRAISILQDHGMSTKGDVRKFMAENDLDDDINGIGPAWTKLIQEAVS